MDSPSLRARRNIIRHLVKACKAVSVTRRVVENYGCRRVCREASITQSREVHGIIINFFLCSTLFLIHELRRKKNQMFFFLRDLETHSNEHYYFKSSWITLPNFNHFCLKMITSLITAHCNCSSATIWSQHIILIIFLVSFSHRLTELSLCR